MTPTAYYAWLFQHARAWLGQRRFQPRPEQNFPVGFVLLAPAVLAGVAVGILGGIHLGLRWGPGASVPAYLFWGVGILVWVCATWHFGFACLAWNQRAARQRAAGTSLPEARPGLVVRWGLGPLYLLLVAGVAPLALLVAVENVRGALRWKATRIALQAQGERLDFRSLLPAPVPPEQNFASLPLFARLFDYGPQTNWVEGKPVVAATLRRDTNAFRQFHVFHLPERQLESPVAGKSRVPSLDDWARAFRSVIEEQAAGRVDSPADRSLPQYPAAPAGASAPEVILTALGVAQVEWQQICEASLRPHVQFPIHWEDGFSAQLPHLSQLKGIQKHLDLRVRAELAGGANEVAFQDLQCGMRVSELLREEPLLISQLVRIAQGAIVAGTVAEAIAAHRWNEAQWREIETRLRAPDYLKGMSRALEGERNGVLLIMEGWAADPGRLRREAEALGLIDPQGSSPGGLVKLASLGLLPRGWIRQNQVRLLEYQQVLIQQSRGWIGEPPRAGYSWYFQEADRLSDSALMREQSEVTPYNVLMTRLAAAVGRALAKSIRAQVTAQSAAVGCSLERYRIQHGRYPETLAALVPQFLPVIPLDLMDGQPLRYARTDEGSFRFWSVGLDGKDDGGVVRLKGRSPGPTEEGLDWVWPN
jgi:hypothetical protein